MAAHVVASNLADVDTGGNDTENAPQLFSGLEGLVREALQVNLDQLNRIREQQQEASRRIDLETHWLYKENDKFVDRLAKLVLPTSGENAGDARQVVGSADWQHSTGDPESTLATGQQRQKSADGHTFITDTSAWSQPKCDTVVQYVPGNLPDMKGTNAWSVQGRINTPVAEFREKPGIARESRVTVTSSENLQDTDEDEAASHRSSPKVGKQSVKFVSADSGDVVNRDSEGTSNPLDESRRKESSRAIQRSYTRDMLAEARKSVFPDSQNKPKAVFADAAAMKDQVRMAVTRKLYNVCDYYHAVGRCQRIARAQWFEYLTLSIIAFNALWISIDTDHNDAIAWTDAHAVFQVAENSFCLYFSWELGVRFFSFRLKRNCCRDAWFVFDTCLVLMMVLETWVGALVIFVLHPGDGAATGVGDTSILKLVRLARLTRMARMAKLLRAVPELIILIKGMVVAARSVFFTLLLLIVFIYFFAIVMRQITDDTDVGELYFKSVPDSMLSLTLDAILPDQAAIVRDCGAEHPVFAMIVLFFILLGSLLVMNMLIGVLCEVVSVVATVEKETLTVSYVNSKLSEMFGEWDTDGNRMISQCEFNRLLVLPEAAQIIQDIGVDVIGLVDFSDFIFKESDELSFVDFIQLILSFRGTNQSTVKDIVDLRKLVFAELSTTKIDILQSLSTLLEAVTEMQVKSLNHLRESLSMQMGLSNSSDKIASFVEKEQSHDPKLEVLDACKQKIDRQICLSRQERGSVTTGGSERLSKALRQQGAGLSPDEASLRAPPENQNSFNANDVPGVPHHKQGVNANAKANVPASGGNSGHCATSFIRPTSIGGRRGTGGLKSPRPTRASSPGRYANTRVARSVRIEDRPTSGSPDSRPTSSRSPARPGMLHNLPVERPCSPALPKFPAQLWIGEDDDCHGFDDPESIPLSQQCQERS